MAEIKATPRNKYLGAASSALRSIRDTGDQVQIPVLGGLGSLLLGKSPEEVEEWSYGNAPMHIPEMTRIPQVKQGRKGQLADAAFLGADLPALRAVAAAAGRPLARALEGSPLYAAARALQEARTPISSVVKQKGGNWLSGSVEDALRGLKREGYNDENPEVDALNAWIEGPLTKYVRNTMATPEDPVRALAEQGVLHFDPREMPERGAYMQKLVESRKATGFPAVGYGDSQLARNWESVSDMVPQQAAYIDHMPLQGELGNEPSGALRRLGGQFAVDNPTAKAYGFNRGKSMNDLGFSHLLDELDNAVNPASGLPRNLQLTPESFKNMGMEKAVRHVAKINEWRAAQRAEADALRANNAATVLHKEYPDDPRGLRWVELRAPDAADPIDAISAGKLGERRKTLSDALKYEGDTMGHCVGGYCDDVLSGRTKIYSLRDAKGQPHVTVEVEPATPGSQMSHDIDTKFKGGDLQPRILQIKGKGNKKPNDEYLPMVQDFVRSGKWSDVGDLENTGLRYAGDAFNDTELAHLRGRGVAALERDSYLTPEEVSNYQKLFKPEGYAQGGQVKAPSNWDGLAQTSSWDMLAESV